jgi:hypothetical protein
LWIHTYTYTNIFARFAVDLPHHPNLPLPAVPLAPRHKPLSLRRICLAPQPRHHSHSKRAEGFLALVPRKVEAYLEEQTRVSRSKEAVCLGRAQTSHSSSSNSKAEACLAQVQLRNLKVEEAYLVARLNSNLSRVAGYSVVILRINLSKAVVSSVVRTNSKISSRVVFLGEQINSNDKVNKVVGSLEVQARISQP